MFECGRQHLGNLPRGSRAQERAQHRPTAGCSAVAAESETVPGHSIAPESGTQVAPMCPDLLDSSTPMRAAFTIATGQRPTQTWMTRERWNLQPCFRTSRQEHASHGTPAWRDSLTLGLDGGKGCS